MWNIVFSMQSAWRDLYNFYMAHCKPLQKHKGERHCIQTWTIYPNILLLGYIFYTIDLIYIYIYILIICFWKRSFWLLYIMIWLLFRIPGWLQILLFSMNQPPDKRDVLCNMRFQLDSRGDCDCMRLTHTIHVWFTFYLHLPLKMNQM